MASIHRSVADLAATLANISALTFPVTNALSGSALAPDDVFEGHLIREAEPAELSLFRPGAGDGRPAPELAEAFAPDPARAGRWEVARRQGPARVQAAGAQGLALPKPAVPREAGDAAATRSYLIAAERLTDAFPLPRFRERVKALTCKLGELETQIAELQSAPPKVQKIAPEPPQPNLDLRKEQLELLALRDLRDEKQAQVRQLTQRISEARKSRIVKASTPIRHPARQLSTPRSSRQPAPLPPSSALKRHTAAEAVPEPAPSASPIARKTEPGPESESGPQLPPAQPNQDLLRPAVLSPAVAHALTKVINWCTRPSPLGGVLATVLDGDTQTRGRQLLGALDAFLGDLSAPPTAEPPYPPSLRMEAAIFALFARTLLDGSSHAGSEDAFAAAPRLPPPGAPPAALGFVVRPRHLFSADAGLDDVCIPLEPFKLALSDLSRAAGWEDGLGQKVIYTLVAKRVLKIDRKGRPLLGLY